MKHRPVAEGGNPINLNQVDPLQAVKGSDAYVSGFNLGKQGSLGLNPYGQNTPEHEYWKLGCTAGYVTFAVT